MRVHGGGWDIFEIPFVTNIFSAPYLDFRDHVAGHKADFAPRLAPVEAVAVLLTVDLDELTLPEGQLLVAGVRIR